MNGYVERLRRDERGFTLIELLIVIVILGILAGIVLFAVGGVTDRGAVAACKNDFKTIQTAVEAYRAKKGEPPPDLVPSLTDPNGDTQFLVWDKAFTNTVSAENAGAGGNVWDPGNGYKITYYPTTGDVVATGACEIGTPPAP
jgi:prepilin-type N-terminal cleavage/methylation domain-containing protein